MFFCTFAISHFIPLYPDLSRFIPFYPVLSRSLSHFIPLDPVLSLFRNLYYAIHQISRLIPYAPFSAKPIIQFTKYPGWSRLVPFGKSIIQFRTIKDISLLAPFDPARQIYLSLQQISRLSPFDPFRQVIFFNSPHIIVDPVWSRSADSIKFTIYPGWWRLFPLAQLY